MNKQNHELQLDGIVLASAYDHAATGKQFLGAVVECSDGTRWVVAYSEQSPYHVFAGRRVLVSGEAYLPSGQQIIQMDGKRTNDGTLRHMRVITMRLVDETPDDRFVEVGAEQQMAGRFEPRSSDIGESLLNFVTENGVSFQVANNPAGATIGRRVEVSAYPISSSVLTRRSTEQCLWIICPHSAADLWKWRSRSQQGS